MTATSNAGAVGTSYAAPVVTLHYNTTTIAGTGGSTDTPDVSWTQKQYNNRGTTNSRSSIVTASFNLNGYHVSGIEATVTQNGDNGFVDTEGTFLDNPAASAEVFSLTNTTGFSVSPEGMVTAGANSGSARSTNSSVSVTVNGQTGVSNSVTITQDAAVVTYRFYFDPDAGNLTVGYTSSAVIKRQRYENGTATGDPEVMSNDLFTFTSSDASKASVNASGTVTGVAEGNGIIITATLKNNPATDSWYDQCQNPGANPKQATATINVVGANSGSVTFPWDEGGEENL